jgi:hypothetical protein
MFDRRSKPRNRRTRRRSKSSLSAPLSASPAGSAIAAPFDLAQHVVSYTIIRTIAPQNTVSSGESGLNNSLVFADAPENRLPILGELEISRLLEPVK